MKLQLTAYKEYFSSLHFRLVLLVILSVLPVACLVVYKSIMDSKQDLNNSKAEATRLAQLTVMGASQIINTSHELLTTLICTNAVRQLDIEACNERFKLIQENAHQIYENIAMTDENGNIIASAVPIGGKKLNSKDRKWWQNLQKVTDIHEVALGCYELNHVTQKPSFNIAHSLLDQKNVAIYVCLGLSNFESIVTTELPEGSVLFIVDEQGTELARNPEGHIYSGKSCPFWDELKAGKFIEAKGLDNVLRMYTILEVPNSHHGLYVGVGLSKELTLQESNKNFIHNITLLLLSILTTCFLAGVIAYGYILADIKKLIKSSIDLRSGDWKAYAKLNNKTGSTEFKKLVQTFIDMTKTLEEGHVNLEQTVEDRTKKIKGMAKKLKIINKDLVRSNEELMKFAYVTSHDLKAPLRAVNNLVNWISEDVKENKDVTRYVNMLHSRTERMSSLIDGLLEYSRVGRTHTEKEIVNINEVIKKIIEDLDHKNIIIENELPNININRIRITQIFSNLIDNATKHHHDPCNLIIKISSISTDTSDVFCVADNGPGIEPQYHEKIFEIFQTLKSRDEVESTGIGLAIVKKIVEEMNGKIWIESSLGQGSKFFFSLPNDKYNNNLNGQDEHE